MARAHRSARAEIDLIEIWGHIAKDDPLAADRQLDLIDEACQMLAGHQHAGKSRDDLAHGLRFFSSQQLSDFLHRARRWDHRRKSAPWRSRLSARFRLKLALSGWMHRRVLDVTIADGHIRSVSDNLGSGAVLICF